ncbi:MAG: hypothetical protein IIZ18_06520 [Ruminococcus sp.]|nr:hypothetical protein [Ruminococcus sp.]
MFVYRQYVDIYYNNVCGGFIEYMHVWDLLAKSRKLAAKVAEKAYTTEVVIYALMFYDTDTGALLVVDLINCRLPYSCYIELVTDMPEGFQICCLKGEMEEMYDD